jgi:hypothetical protein
MPAQTKPRTTVITVAELQPGDTFRLIESSVTVDAFGTGARAAQEKVLVGRCESATLVDNDDSYYVTCPDAGPRVRLDFQLVRQLDDEARRVAIGRHPLVVPTRTRYLRPTDLVTKVL